MHINAKRIIFNNSDKICSICHDDENLIILDDTILECAHAFHTECIAPWLKKENTCPLCRDPISNSNKNKNNDYKPMGSGLYHELYDLISDALGNIHIDSYDDLTDDIECISLLFYSIKNNNINIIKYILESDDGENLLADVLNVLPYVINNNLTHIIDMLLNYCHENDHWEYEIAPSIIKSLIEECNVEMIMTLMNSNVMIFRNYLCDIINMDDTIIFDRYINEFMLFYSIEENEFDIFETLLTVINFGSNDIKECLLEILDYFEEKYFSLWSRFLNYMVLIAL